MVSEMISFSSLTVPGNVKIFFDKTPIKRRPAG
jgi:hypothetical protein